jgi:hypothetical protein
MRCADCGVELIAAPPQLGGQANSDDEDPFCEFWRGDDLRLQGEICQVLGEEGIPFRTLQLNDVLSMVGIPLRQPAFRIGVQFSMFERAERAVAEAFGDVSEDQNLGKFLTAGESE